MARALFLVIIPGLLTTLSIAGGATHGKPTEHPRSVMQAALRSSQELRLHAQAQVKVIAPTKKNVIRPPGRQTNTALAGSRTGRTSLKWRPVTSDEPSSDKRHASNHRELLSIVRKPDIHSDDQVFLDHVLRMVPALCRESIEHLVVRYPSTEFTPSSVEGLKPSDIERGQATATTMILRGPLASLPEKEQAEMIGVIFHECGHIVDLGALQGSKIAGESPYPDAHIPTYDNDPSRLFYEISWKNVTQKHMDAEDEDFVSGYAQADPFEDLAESLVYFALHERAFRERSNGNPVLARKLRWLETYVFVDGYSPTPSEGWPASRSLGAGWDGTIAWDVTKIVHNFAF